MSLLPTCTADGCTEQAPFDTTDGPRCFTHDPSNAVFFAAKIEAEVMAELHDLAGGVTDGASLAPAVVTTTGKGSGGARRGRSRRDAPADELNDTAARALSALILQATADALTGDKAKMEQALLTLAADLPAPLEVAAGILFAMTAVAGAGGLTDGEVFTVGAAFEDIALQETEEQTAP